MKNPKIFWTEVITHKTTKSEAKISYNELIQNDIDTLEREKSNGFEKFNIFNILENVGLLFNGVYFH